MNTVNTVTVGDRIRWLRREKGLSQSDIAGEDERVSVGYISFVERGQRTPSYRALRIIARNLGTTPEYLETGREAPLDRALREVRELHDVALSEWTCAAYATVIELLEKIRKEWS